MHESAASVLSRLNDLDDHLDAASYQLPTGFSPLDDVLDGGLSHGDLCILGGAPGIGKTILALQMARNMAQTGKRVLYCCYEHDVPTLLGRLVSLEIGESGEEIPPADDALLRSSIKAIMAGHWSSNHQGAKHPVLRAAMARVAHYGEGLVLAQLSTTMAGLGVIHQHIVQAEPRFEAVFVDYLQKVGVDGGATGPERWAIAVEELKDIALTENCLVVAISALDEEALKSRRSTLNGLRGADAIAHEADVAIVLNDKLKIVSRSHLAFDTTRTASFARKVVCTVEKNRRGRAPFDIEFNKDFSRFRVDPSGGFVNERLIDDILTDE